MQQLYTLLRILTGPLGKLHKDRFAYKHEQQSIAKKALEIV